MSTYSDSPKPTEKFWQWIARVRPDLMEYVSRQFHSDAEREAYLVGVAIGRDGAFYDVQQESNYAGLARALTGNGGFDLNDYLFPAYPGVQRARAEDKADALADDIIAKLPRAGDDTPPTRDDDDPGFGDTDIEECVGPDCPCWQDGFDSGYDAALEDLGIEPDDDGDVT